MTNVEIAPLKCLIANRYFYNMVQAESDTYSAGTAFAISSYKGNVPSFSVRIKEHGGLFHNIPVQAIAHKNPERPILDELLTYDNCPDYEMVVNAFDYLRGPVKTFIGGTWHAGRYVLSLDWIKANLNTHLIQLDNGQFCFIPSHKTLFKSKAEKLPSYKKLYVDFSVDK